jgi:hypothetical protein
VMVISKQYGVSEKTIYNWLWLGTEDKISLIEHNKLKRENTELKAIIGALTIEVERLKKEEINGRSLKECFVEYKIPELILPLTIGLISSYSSFNFLSQTKTTK